VSDWNAGIVEEFRTNDGAVGGMFDGWTLLLLHSTGAKSGKERLAPLVYRQEGDRRFIFASKAGAPTHPDWFHNILADGSVKVEAPGETYDAVAVQVSDPERTEIYTRQGIDRPNFAEYQEGLDRLIPVVELQRV
jgi:deazaflavin-dependent oxidoreductase (nitroreductase family)